MNLLSIARRAIGAALVVAALAPASADAGVFTLYSCRTPTGAPAPAEGWSVVKQTDVDGRGAGVYCNVGLAVTASLNGRNIYSSGDSAAVGFSINTPGLTAGSAVLMRSLLIKATPNAGSWASETITTADGTLAEQKAFAQTIGNANEPLNPANRLEITQPFKAGTIITARVSCNASEYCGSVDGYLAELLIHQAMIQIQDSISPTFTSAAGDLLQQGAPVASVSGAPAVVVQASDVGSGLFRLVVTADGVDVATGAFPDGGGRCVPLPGTVRGFTTLQPCLGQGSASLTWDTTKVADGLHSVQLLVEDASGNRTVVAAGRTLVANRPGGPGGPGGVPAVGPGSALELRGGPNGSAATDEATMSLVWPATAKVPRQDRSTKRRCARSDTYRRLHPVWCGGSPARSELNTSWSKTKANALSGRLVTASGVPISGAAIELASTSPVPGSAPVPLPGVSTDADGRFAATIPRAGGSQTIAASWRARVNDTIAVASTQARVDVRAATGLEANRRIRSGQKVTFRGTLRSKVGNLERVPIELQAQVQGRWRTFAVANTGPDGRWEFRRTFRTRGRYTVRARVGSVVSYPWAAGAGTRKVTFSVG